MRHWKLALPCLCAALFAAGAALLAAGAARAQEPVKIRASWVAPLANWASILAEKKDLAQHAGKSYVMEPVRYAGTPLMITASGFATPFPARSGAVPCTASNTAAWSPMFAPGTTPRPPTSPAHRAILQSRRQRGGL